MALGGSPHQRGLALVVFVSVDVGAMLQQNLNGIRVAGARGCHQYGFAVGGGQGFGVRAGLEKRLDHGGVADRRRFGKRCGAVAVGDRRVGSRAKQQVDGVEIVPMGGPVESRGSVRLSRIHVHVLSYQRADSVHVAMLDRIRDLGACNAAGEHATLTAGLRGFSCV